MSKHKVAELLNHSIDPTSKVTSSMLVTADNVGIEVELENLTPELDYRLKYWRTTADGSLRDNGLEFVFRQPMGGVDVVHAARELTTFIKKHEIPIQLSDRTSVHVHLDVRDMDVEEMFNLIVTYAFVERVMMRYCGEERMNNNFCIPLYELGSTAFINRISHLKDETEFQRYANTFGENERYTAFNLNALLAYGSIEFRGYHGTYDSEEILRWVNVILSLKKFAMETPFSFCSDLHTNISKLGVMKIFHRIFNPEISQYLMSSYTTEDLVNGIPVVQDLIIMADVIKGAEAQLRNTKYKENPLIKRLMYVHNRPLFLDIYGTEKEKEEETKVEKVAIRSSNPFEIPELTADQIRHMREVFDNAAIDINPTVPQWVVEPIAAPRPRRTTAVADADRAANPVARPVVDDDGNTVRARPVIQPRPRRNNP